MPAKEIAASLEQGYFFNVRVEGVRRVKTILSEWADEFTEVKHLKHIFARTAKGTHLPSPRFFAIRMGSLGWWTSDLLYKQNMESFREKVAAERARFLKMLSDRFFFERVKEVAGEVGRDVIALIESIKFSVPSRKMRILEADETQLVEIERCYKREMCRLIKGIIAKLKVLLVKGKLGRKTRVRELSESFALLAELNRANYLSGLVKDLGLAFHSIRDLDRGRLPNLTKHLDSDEAPEDVKAALKQLIDVMRTPGAWRL